MSATAGKLARLSAVYVLGDILTRGAALLLLPFYTRLLTPDQYGIVGAAEMVKQVLLMLLPLGLTGAVNRFHHQLADDAARRRAFGAMWLLLILGPLLATLALDLWGRPLLAALFPSTPFDPYLRLAIWTAYLQSAFVLIPPVLLRAREQAGRYIAYNLGFFALTNSMILLLVGARGGGAAAYLGAQLIASALMAVIAVAFLLPAARPALAWGALAPMLAYSLPLVPHFLGHWALGLADRAIVERYAGLAALGVYTLAFQIGAVAQVALTAGSNALLPTFARAARDPAELARLPRAATYYALAAAALVLALALAAADIVRLATPPAYHGAAPLAVVLVVAALPLGLYYLPMSALAQTAGRTAEVPLLTLVAAAVNIGLNLLLVPRFGAMGAAVAAVAGYAALLALVALLARRVAPVAFEYGRVARILLAFGASLALGLAGLRLGPLANLLLVPPLLLLLPLALTLLGFWRPGELAALRSLAPLPARR
jgi:O-antigen/teichoic acid export membrane protein